MYARLKRFSISRDHRCYYTERDIDLASKQRDRAKTEISCPFFGRNGARFSPLARAKSYLSLSWKRTAAIKLVEGNGSSSFYCDTSPPYAPSIYTYIYISARDAQVNASNNQPEAIPPLTNDALSSNSIVTDVQRARY